MVQDYNTIEQSNRRVKDCHYVFFDAFDRMPRSE
jgi:hypothetical protein